MIHLKKYSELNEFEKIYIEKKYQFENKEEILRNKFLLFFRKSKMQLLLKKDQIGLSGALSFVIKSKFIEIDIWYVEEKTRLQGLAKELLKKLRDTYPFKDIIVSLNKCRKDITSCMSFLRSNGFEFLEYKGSEQIVFIKKPGN